MRFNKQCLVILFVGSILLTGCFQTSVLIPYPSQVTKIKTSIQACTPQIAYDYLDSKVEGPDKALYLAERARVSQINNDIERSMADYELAIRSIEEKRFSIDTQQATHTLMSLLTNDNQIPYEPPAYEKIFMHTYQALNYLQKKNIEDAMVEIRRANNEQVYEEQQRALDASFIDAQYKKNNIDWQDKEQALEGCYGPINQAVGDIKKSYQNAYTYYISGVISELYNEGNQTQVFYKKALELYQDNTYLRASVRKAYKGTKGTKIIIVYEEGFVQPKSQIKIPIPYNNRLYTIALPYYKDFTKESALTIYGDNDKWNTQTICNPQHFAALVLKEEYKAIVLRHILRLIVRDQTQKKAQKTDIGHGLNGLLSMGTTLSSWFLDNADLRSWLTLPRSIQIAEFYTTHTSLDLVLEAPDLPKQIVHLDLVPNTTKIIQVINTGNSISSKILW